MDVSVAEKAIERLLEPTAGLSGWLLSLNGIIVDVVRENEGLTREECAKSVPGGLGVVGYYSTEQIPDRKALGCRVDRKAGTISFFMDGKPTSYTPVKPSPLLSVTYVRASIRRTLLSLSPASLKPLTSQIRSSKLLYSPETQTLLTSDEQWNAFLFQDNKDDVKSRVVHEVVLGIRGETGAQQAPAVSFGVKGKSIKGVEILLDGVVAVKPGDGFETCLATLKATLISQVDALSRTQNTTFSLFWPPQMAYPISMLTKGLVLKDGTSTDRKLADLRKRYHVGFHLPLDRPLLRATNAIPFQRKGCRFSNKLRNVHLNIKSSNLKGGKMYMVQGDYLYCHYMQDSFDDKGWGCAYRTFQTICSWLLLQGYTSISIPSHHQIQKAVVECDDNQKPSLVGSKQWIGAIEIQLILKHLYNVDARIIHVSSGGDVNSKARELAQHFQREGSPVMIGGGVLAYGLMGVHWNESTGECNYLILDPHYTGEENMSKIVSGGWCSWKSSDLFLADKFYNFCLPQRPREL